MSTRRLQKAAQAIRQVVSMAILTELRDPRIRDVTVIAVEVSPDMREAKVHVSIMGDETKQRLSLLGLRNAAGFLQSKVAEGIDTRYTPRLEFVLDQGVKKSIEIAQILRRVLPPEEGSEHSAEDAGETGSSESAEDIADSGRPVEHAEEQEHGQDEADGDR